MNRSTSFACVEVKFADPKLDYATSVNAENTDAQIRAYFVGQRLQVGGGESLHRCVEVEITR